MSMANHLLFSEEFTSEMRDPGIGGMGLRVRFRVLLRPGAPGLRGATVKDCSEYIAKHWNENKRPPVDVRITDVELLP